MIDRTDLESRVFLAIAKTMPTKQPAAVLEEIRKTHCLISYADMDTLIDEAWNGQSASVHSMLLRLWPDEWPVEPTRQNAAKSDTSESTP